LKSVLVYAYREFEERVGKLTPVPRTKSQAVRLAFEAFGPGQTSATTKLERACPTVSRATIRRVLEELRAQGQVECQGTGRSARWRKV
jgi:hypothetical protein